MIGRTIGNYVVREKIGEGGMGVVYLAEHPRIARRVAVKVLLAHHGKDQEIVNRFFTEARAANEIRNEHIIDILDFGELDNGTPYFVMEWLDGQSLDRVLAKGARLAFPRTLHILDGVGSALSAAHAHSIVHRDLKPDNVFLIHRESDPEFVKVLDFGVAKLLQDQLQNLGSDMRTRNDVLLGTPSYMSPEQCRGAGRVDQRSDIYAMGVLLYQMTTGRLPFVAQGLGELLVLHMTADPPLPRSIDPQIPEALEAVTLHALAKSPDQRYQTVQAMLDDLHVCAPPAAMERPARMSGQMPVVQPLDTPIVLESPRPDVGTLSEAAAELIERAHPTSVLRGSGWGLAAISGLAVAAVAAVAIFFGWSHRSTIAPAAQAIPDAAMITTTAPPPDAAEGSLAVEPPRVDAALAVVKLSLETLPATAEIFLDDKPLANPFSGTFPRDQEHHRLLVKAKGYRAESSTVMLDHDQALKVELKRSSSSSERVALPAPPPTSEDPSTSGTGSEESVPLRRPSRRGGSDLPNDILIPESE